MYITLEYILNVTINTIEKIYLFMLEFVYNVSFQLSSFDNYTCCFNLCYLLRIGDYRYQRAE